MLKYQWINLVIAVTTASLVFSVVQRGLKALSQALSQMKKLRKLPYQYFMKTKKQQLRSNQMFDKLFAFFKDEVSLAHMGSLLSTVEALLQHFGTDYIKDGNAYNAAIDAVIEVLQSQKK
jgi:hypothetical protein